MNKREKWIGYLFVGPNLLGVLVFMVIPCLFAVILSFSNWNHLSSLLTIDFVGFEKFQTMLNDENFFLSLKNNMIYTFLGVPITLAISLFIAVILNDKVFMKKTMRAMFFMPYITNGIAVAFVWMLLFSPVDGPINSFLMSIGVNEPPGWLTSTKWALPALVVIYIWSHIGFNIIIYLANLQSISKELYEAADVDGASAWHKFINITFPMVTPSTFFLLITGVIGSFKVFGIVVGLTGGGPAGSTYVLGYYIYITAFRYYDIGYASALSLVLFVMILIITILQWIGQKKWVHY